MTDSDKPQSDDDQKIVVDTDWKEQVAKEKEQAAQAKADSSQTDSAQTDSAKSDSTDDFVPMDKAADKDAEVTEQSEPPAGDPSQSPPPASLEVLLSMLFTQAMACLGQMPNPATGKPEINKPFAKHYIDTIEMLGEKTKGNTTEDETKMLGEALHALRMAFVSVKA
ncbi:DUF1844 domain-containing protein [Planctomycetes bacterium K23_9]|uniref:DUF1844 domain-containing protein n=1 Tax=Stieleria marina TaxID=1930275 RepID=A0A517NPA5_9BACT|nr:hypothetical protein K239x_09040 [Planctomycetes bacterium K23_9]